MTGSILVKHFSRMVLAASIFVSVAIAKPQHTKPFFRQDLRLFGFAADSHGGELISFTDINFLSDDLLLVTINNRSHEPVEYLFSDTPPSKLLLFNASRKTLLKTTVMAVEKQLGSVRATRDGQFVLFNGSGLHLCSPELECGLPFATRGPLFVSPQGTRIVVGGNARSEQRLLDVASLKELDQFDWMNPSVIPGDAGLLVRRSNKLYVRLPEKQDQPLSFGGKGVWPEARFLNDNTVADLESLRSLAVAKVDGTIMYRVPVRARSFVAELETAASGSRFCFHEAGYTTLNSIINFLDIDSGRPLNYESVQVLLIDSGKSLFELRWNPQPYAGYLSAPALSPNGRRIAVIRHGFLEIFEVP